MGRTVDSNGLNTRELEKKWNNDLKENKDKVDNNNVSGYQLNSVNPDKERGNNTTIFKLDECTKCGVSFTRDGTCVYCGTEIE